MEENGGHAEFYAGFLRREGYVPQSDGDGSVVFKREGRSYVVNADAKDPMYFQMIRPNIWHIEDETERREAIEACNLATQATKVVKVFATAEGWVHLSVELFCESPEEVCKIIPRCFSAMDVAAARFVQELQGA
ncbi:MAG TPA: hypothetical protein VLA09_00675 [Longimicrobiales bacterium]|nr:hypothetical protein [Longimicrobiales bacterium]